MNKKLWWSTALAPVAILAPALTTISCSTSSSSQSYQFASSEAGEYNFLSFKWSVSQIAAGLMPVPGQDKLLEQQILQNFKYNDLQDLGLKQLKVTIDKKNLCLNMNLLYLKGI